MYRWMTRIVAGAVIAACSGASADWAAASWGGARILDGYIDAASGNARGEQAFMSTSGFPSERVMLGTSPYTASFPVARLRRANGTMTRPQALTSRHGLVAQAGSIGLDGRGTATALWTLRRAHALELYASVRPRGGQFARGSLIGAVASSSFHFDHVMRVAPDGGAVVVWNGGDRIYVAQRPPGRCPQNAPRACFGQPQTFSRCPAGIADCLDSAFLQLAVGRGGRAFVAWPRVSRTGLGYRTGARLAVARPGHRFGHSMAISEAPDVSIPADIALLRDGGAIVTWVRGATLRRQRVMAARFDRSGIRRVAPSVLSATTCVDPRIRVDPQDEVTIVWICDYDPGLESISIVAFGGPAFAPLTSGVALGRRDYASRDALGFDGAGNVVLVYSPDGNTSVTRLRPPGGTFGEPTPVPMLTGSRAPVELGGRLIEAGPRLTLLQTGEHATSQLRDWTP